MGWSKIFRTDAVKIVKLTLRPIGRRHSRNSYLPHVDTGSIVSSIFGTRRGSPFLSECQALFAIRSGSPQWYQTSVISASISVLEIGRNHRVPNQGSTLGGGWQPFCRSVQFSSVQCRRWRTASSGQMSGSWAQIWLRHGACPIFLSEPAGMSHNQFRPPQQCCEWSDINPDGQALEFVQ